MYTNKCCQASRAGFGIDMARAPVIASYEMDQLHGRDDGREDASTWVVRDSAKPQLAGARGVWVAAGAC